MTSRTTTSPARATPGPWTVDSSGYEIRSPAVAVAIALHESRRISDEERKANALLMAAAPELLDACKMVAEDARMALRGEWNRDDIGFEVQLERLEQVIGRAEAQSDAEA